MLMSTWPRPERKATLEQLVDWAQKLVVVLQRRDVQEHDFPVAPSYLKAKLPSAAKIPGAHALVVDEVGGTTLAFSDGTNWRRVQDRAIVS